MAIDTVARVVGTGIGIKVGDPTDTVFPTLFRNAVPKRFLQPGGLKYSWDLARSSWVKSRVKGDGLFCKMLSSAQAR